MGVKVKVSVGAVLILRLFYSQPHRCTLKGIIMCLRSLVDILIYSNVPYSTHSKGLVA